MTNGATTPIGFRLPAQPSAKRAVPRFGNGGDGPTPPAADRLWSEHGWSLSGAAVAVLVGAVLVASCAVQLLG